MQIKVNAKNFKRVVLNSTQPVVVDVWADWCGPCKMLAPNFRAAADELKGKARFVKIDADKNQKLVKKLNVRGLPTLLFFNEGVLVHRSSGVLSKQAIIKRLKPMLSAEDQKELKTGFNWKFWE